MLRCFTSVASLQGCNNVNVGVLPCSEAAWSLIVAPYEAQGGACGSDSALFDGEISLLSLQRKHLLQASLPSFAHTLTSTGALLSSRCQAGHEASHPPRAGPGLPLALL